MEVALNSGMNLTDLITAEELHKAVHEPPSDIEYQKLNEELQELFGAVVCLAENEEEHETVCSTVMILAWALRRKRLV